MHTTNYFDTLIEIAPDSPVDSAKIPPEKEQKTIARLQYEMLLNAPYRYSSDDVLFEIYALRNQIKKSESKKARENFFSKGQACFRSSPLTKQYGFGVHSNSDGRIALVPAESKEYAQLSRDKKVKKVKAMRSSRK